MRPRAAGCSPRALDLIEGDDDVRAVVITGTGRAFTSGANLREDQALTDEQLADYIGEFSGMLNRIEALRMPVIAAISGASVGGGLEFALACDIRSPRPRRTDEPPEPHSNPRSHAE
ncbi:hypothetical protein GCM10009609_48600 [Pseudonocardia aurantiaca]|uniref:Enoyl-CoA hydratase/isomerase family protein n=1 Tax=Pseudonocardia aurantiaca TaxID=75290 RepID=A0ABW4FX43_9PSEU